MARFSYCLCLFTMLTSVSFAEENAIDRYISAADDSYTWKVVGESKGDGYKTVIIDMTSQTWRTPEEVNRTKWQHWLTVVIPDQVRSDVGFVMVGGGSNGKDVPTSAEDRMVTLARYTGTVVTALGMIPNQPLIFHGDGENRVEDNLIGYTWNQYIKSGDPTWLARAPMTKSVVRAMDTVTAYMGSVDGGEQSVDKFVVSGGSKRGWTTWITGAMDKRVVGIAPIVIDVLNGKKSMKHHFAAYGFWAPSIGDYVRHRIMPRMDDPDYDSINALVDPISYVDRLTMPKFVLNAAGDQFFLPDSSQFYWDQLQGPKNLRYIPNTDHSMRGSDVLESLVAWYTLVVRGDPAPELTWSVEDGVLQMKPDMKGGNAKLEQVLLWQATNPLARDFRMETLGPKYTSTKLQPGDDGTYTAKLQNPNQGWRAQFIEATFDVGAPTKLKQTTSVYVTPDVLPFQLKDPKLEASLTVTCEAQDERVAKEVISTVTKLVAAGVLKAPELTTEQVGSRVFFNWRPPLEQFTPAAMGLTKLLSDKGCTKFAYQLESGLGATVPPGLPLLVE